MSRTILNKILRRDKKRRKLLSELLELKQIVRGSFCQIHVKCGKKYCRCKNGQLHPHRRMSWREKGHDFSRAVPKEDYEWIEKMTGNYRMFRKLRKEIMKLEKEIKEMLNEYEESLVNKMRKGKSYLDVWNG